MPTSTSLTRAVRREQLLDAAADLVAERGVAGVTMEGVAAMAGASKALPYRHFANADAVLVALYHRELDLVADRVTAAVRTSGRGDAVLRAAIGAYFEVVDERGAILAVLAGAGSPVPDLEGAGRARSPELVARLVADAYGIDDETARALGALLVGLVTAASDAIGLGLTDRATAERLAAAASIGAVRAVIRAERGRR